MGELREGFGGETVIASATSMAETCSVSQDRGPGFLLEACLEFCQAESASPFFSSSLSLSALPRLPVTDPEHPQPASCREGPAVPGWKPLPEVTGSTFLFSVSLPIPVGSRMPSRAEGGNGNFA